MKEINVTENNDVVANVRFIIDVEHCFPSAHLCAVQLEGSKGCQILFDPHFSDTGKMAVECQSICTWLVWALPFLLHQKVKNLRAECWSGELSTRIHTQLAGGNVCWEHKDIGARPPPLALDGGVFVWLSESISQQHTSDVTSADVDTLAALSVLLCALGNNKKKNTVLPIFFRPEESPSNLPWNEAVKSNWFRFQFGHRVQRCTCPTLSGSTDLWSRLLSSKVVDVECDLDWEAVVSSNHHKLIKPQGVENIFFI